MRKFFYELSIEDEFKWEGQFYKKINEYDAEDIHTGEIDAIIPDDPVELLAKAEKKANVLRVRMFWVNGSVATAETLIEEWLSENLDIEIKYILQSVNGSSDDTALLISIWYIEAQ